MNAIHTEVPSRCQQEKIDIHRIRKPYKVTLLTIKTTVMLREDLHERIIRRYGRRGLSRTVNEALERMLVDTKKSMFGSDPWLNATGVRDERDPHEGL